MSEVSQLPDEMRPQSHFCHVCLVFMVHLFFLHKTLTDTEQLNDLAKMFCTQKLQFCAGCVIILCIFMFLEERKLPHLGSLKRFPVRFLGGGTPENPSSFTQGNMAVRRKEVPPPPLSLFPRMTSHKIHITSLDNLWQEDHILKSKFLLPCGTW